MGLSSVTVSSGPLPRLYTTGAMHVKLSKGKSMCYTIDYNLLYNKYTAHKTVLKTLMPNARDARRVCVYLLSYVYAELRFVDALVNLKLKF